MFLFICSLIFCSLQTGQDTICCIDTSGQNESCYYIFDKEHTCHYCKTTGPGILSGPYEYWTLSDSSDITNTYVFATNIVVYKFDYQSKHKYVFIGAPNYRMYLRVVDIYKRYFVVLPLFNLWNVAYSINMNTLQRVTTYVESCTLLRYHGTVLKITACVYLLTICIGGTLGKCSNTEPEHIKYKTRTVLNILYVMINSWHIHLIHATTTCECYDDFDCEIYYVRITAHPCLYLYRWFSCISLRLGSPHDRTTMVSLHDIASYLCGRFILRLLHKQCTSLGGILCLWMQDYCNYSNFDDVRYLLSIVRKSYLFTYAAWILYIILLMTTLRLKHKWHLTCCIVRMYPKVFSLNLSVYATYDFIYNFCYKYLYLYKCSYTSVISPWYNPIFLCIYCLDVSEGNSYNEPQYWCVCIYDITRTIYPERLLKI